MTALKIQHNPYARAFQDRSNSKSCVSSAGESPPEQQLQHSLKIAGSASTVPSLCQAQQGFSTSTVLISPSHFQQLQLQQLQPHYLRPSPYSPQQRLHRNSTSASPSGVPFLMKGDSNLPVSRTGWTQLPSQATGVSPDAPLEGSATADMMWSEFYPVSPTMSASRFSPLASHSGNSIGATIKVLTRKVLKRKFLNIKNSA